MANVTLTKNIKLRISSNLTADAKYNLERLDLLGSTFLVDSTNTLNIRAQTHILIEPESADVDGSGVGGNVSIGTANHLAANIDLWGTSVTVPVSLGLKDQGLAGTTHLRLKYNSTINGTLDSADRNLSLDLEGADRSIVLGGSYTQLGGDLILNLTGPTSLILPQTGTVATLSNVETLTNKSIDGLQNTLTNIQYASLNLTNSIVNSDISTTAAIAYSKLALSNSIINADIAGNAAIAYSKLNLVGSIINADISPTASVAYSKLNLDSAIVNADISPSASISRSKLAAQSADYVVVNDVDGLLTSIPFLPVVQGGTGAITAQAATNNLLPTQVSNAGKVLSTDGTNTSWISVGGTGSVTSVDVVGGTTGLTTSGGPITAAGTITLAGTLAVSNGGTNSTTALTNNKVIISAGSSLVESSVTTTALGFISTLSSDAQTQINTKQVAGNYITSLSGDVVATGPDAVTATIQPGVVTNAKIAAAAGISVNKLAAQATTRAVVTDGSGFLTTANTTTTEINFVSGVTSAIQTQLDTTEKTANKGVANGYASLDGTGKIPSGQLPTVLQVFKQTWITADGTTKTVTHSLASLDVIVQVYDLTDGQTIELDSTVRTDSNTVTLTASVAPGAAGYRVLILAI